MQQPYTVRCKTGFTPSAPTKILVGAGEWQALENGRRWRMVGAGEWQALENGSRWILVGAGEW
jgi:hypothetical protein